jgi:hypothetical protein
MASERVILQYSTLRSCEFEDDGNQDEVNAVSAVSTAETDHLRLGSDLDNRPDRAGRP